MKSKNMYEMKLTLHLSTALGEPSLTWVLKPMANVSGKICVLLRLLPISCQKVTPLRGTCVPGSTVSTHSKKPANLDMPCRLRWMICRRSVGFNVKPSLRGVHGLSSFIATARSSSTASGQCH